MACPWPRESIEANLIIVFAVLTVPLNLKISYRPQRTRKANFVDKSPIPAAARNGPRGLGPR
jgi:hypothetical protein